jgi:hypothetical protein
MAMALRTWLARVGFPRRNLDPALRTEVEKLSAAVAAGAATIHTWRRVVRDQDLSLEPAIDRLKESDLHNLRRSVSALQSFARRQLQYTGALQAFRPNAARNASRRVIRRLATIAAANRPILAGPWDGDVGMELLYWVPFLRWFAMQFRIPPTQLHVLSRGEAPWYKDIAGSATDVLSLYSPSEWRARTAGRAQGTFRGFERELIGRVQDIHPEPCTLLHPGLMFRLFQPYWNHEAPLDHVLNHTVPNRLPPRPTVVPGLPERFIAARFAFSDTLPDTPGNRAWVNARLTSLTESNRVVWLGSGTDGQDAVAPQGEYTPPAGLDLIDASHFMAGPESLAHRAAIVATADAYVGTYGGLSYLAAYYGVKSIAYYAVRSFFPHHRSVAQEMVGGPGRQAPIVVNIDDDALLRRVLDVVPRAAVSGASA